MHTPPPEVGITDLVPGLLEADGAETGGGSWGDVVVNRGFKGGLRKHIMKL